VLSIETFDDTDLTQKYPKLEGCLFCLFMLYIYVRVRERWPLHRLKT